MFGFKFVPILFCALLFSTLILSINASPIKPPSSTLTFEDDTSTSTTSDSLTFSNLLSFSKKAASKAFEAVGSFLSVIGESLSSDADEEIPDKSDDEDSVVENEKVEYPPKDDNPYLEDEATKKEEKPLIASPKSSQKSKKKADEKFEGFI
uniref:Uncharacterized protein n=1 Tax=Panagrolaimus davidi TaxID=227884 RepID=A0A914Q8C5_9BILA